MTLPAARLDFTNPARQATGWAISPTVLVTAGHAAQTVGQSVTVTIGSTVTTGTVAFVGAGSPEGATITVGPAIADDYAFIILAAPQTGLQTFNINPSADFTNSIACTQYGYPSLVGGAENPICESAATTVNTTQYPYVLAGSTMWSQGASGGPVVDPTGLVVGIIESDDSPYQLITGISPTFATLVDNVLSETADRTALITALYQFALHRTPSAAEVQYYLNYIAGGGHMADILGFFYASPEYQSTHITTD